jgi:hypothetical protein
MKNISLHALFLSMIIVLVTSLGASGQETLIKGRVLDSLTRKPVSFASVVSSSQGRGTNANVDGYFSFTVKKPGEKLTISSIGYKRQTWTSTDGANEIFLAPVSANMEAIVIKPNDIQDPFALSIIRKAIDNRRNNDPEELGSFSYTSYSKGVVDTLKDDRAKKVSGKIITPSANKDTGRYQFMVESVFEHKYKKPGLHNNRMTAQRVSGLGNPYIIGLITQIQYFSFYKDDFNVLRSQYHNPVSNKYYKSYVFSLVDSIRGNDDKLTYIISFRPRYKSMGLSLLKGQVHIHDADFAIVNVEASAYYSSSTSSITFKQNYEQVEGRWFPKQLLTQLMLLPGEEEDDRKDEDDAAVKFNVTSYLKDIQLNPELKRSAFSNYEITIDENSGKRTDRYWDEKREMPLDNSEKRTFVYLDSVLSRDTGFRKFERRADVIGYLISGKIPVGNVNIELRDIVKLNEFETVRLGFGLSTNERFSEYHKLGASFGYGFRDNAWKYGGYYEYKPSRDNDLTLGVSYKKDIYLWGMSGLLLPGIRSRNYQYLLTDKADDIRKTELYTRFRMLKKVEALAFANYQEREFNHGYEYSVPGSTGKNVTSSIYEAGIRVTTRFKQAKIKYGSLVLNGFKKDDPRLAIDLRAGRSVDGIEGIEYVRIEGLYENNFNLGRLGKVNYNISGGHISGTTPYSMLFSNLGTNRRSFDLFVPSTFSSMAPFEFTNTSYAALYTEFETGYIVQKRKKWGVSLFFPNSVGVGRYDQDMTHNVAIRQMNKVYSETGMGLKFRTRKRSVGVAAIYRYGNYSATDFADNIYFRVLVDR